MLPSWIGRRSLEGQIRPFPLLQIPIRRVIDDQAGNQDSLLIPTCHRSNRFEPRAEDIATILSISSIARDRARRPLWVPRALTGLFCCHHILMKDSVSLASEEIRKKGNCSNLLMQERLTWKVGDSRNGLIFWIVDSATAIILWAKKSCWAQIYWAWWAHQPSQSQQAPINSVSKYYL